MFLISAHAFHKIKDAKASFSVNAVMLCLSYVMLLLMLLFHFFRGLMKITEEGYREKVCGVFFPSK